MPTLETAIRLIVIGQQLLLAAVFLFGAGNRTTRYAGTLLMLGFVGYVYTSDDMLREAVPLLVPVTTLLSIIAPYCLWLFARAVFEASWPRALVIYVCVFIILGTWGIYLFEHAVSPQVLKTALITIRVVGLVVVAHAVWLALKGRPDDLVEGRRVFRLFFIVIISIQVATVLLVELVLGVSGAPPWVNLVNIIVIELLTIGLAIPMLSLNRDFFELEPGGDRERREQEASGLGAAERVYRQKLLDLMDGGYYRETGLTIPMLAAKIDYPEHRLRRLINGHLGYRNFPAFINSYRIDEAKKRLADPEHARIPVLTIALDLGYASLGPFNRAFKATTDLTPTDYRRQSLGDTRADFE